MAEYTADALQVVSLNQNVLFTDTVVKSCCDVTHREGSGLFTLHGGHKYSLFFGGNIAGATAGTPIALAVEINGEAVSGSTMIATPAGADDFQNVSTNVQIVVPRCCCYIVSIGNVGTTAVSVENANLVIVKEV